MLMVGVVIPGVTSAPKAQTNLRASTYLGLRSALG